MAPNHDRRITLAILVSLLLHLLIIFFMGIPLPDLKLAEEELEVMILGKEIADISPPEKEERPDKAHFLGLYDSKVDEERVGVTEPIPPSRRRVVTGPDGREAPRSREGAERAARIPDSDLGPPEDGEEINTNLPEEFFPNIKVGERTYLNVLRYPKISYFVRLKKIIKLTWDPQPIIGHYYFLNQISAGKIETTVALQISREGELRKLFVLRSSGFPLYDDEAVRAIQDSAPFAAPPKDLLDPDGVLPLIYTFVVYL